MELTICLLLFSIFVLSCFIGALVVRNVTPALHAPLMSVTNAVSGIVLIGAIRVIASGQGIGQTILGLSAVFVASVNIFGGFAVSARMLEMFRQKEKK
jgi:NAD(P) transhydrogenase subunit alpha